MIRVFVRPTGLHSRAMLRVATALATYAPPSIQIVDDPRQSDFRVLHAIGPGLFDGIDENQPHAVIQYCLKSAGMDEMYWSLVWQRAHLVWSYYDMSDFGGNTLFNFYHAPLGVDPAFAQKKLNGQARDIGIMSSGYVSHPAAEAISEVAWAGFAAGKRVLHLGPSKVEGMITTPPGWMSVMNVNDEALAEFYSHTEWVSGLRHVEGFELPALEGLACGARPILFDRPEMRQWYDGHATFIPECDGQDLVERLTDVVQQTAPSVSEKERAQVLHDFAWERIATGFWEKLL